MRGELYALSDSPRVFQPLSCTYSRTRSSAVWSAWSRYPYPLPKAFNWSVRCDNFLLFNMIFNSSIDSYDRHCTAFSHSERIRLSARWLRFVHFQIRVKCVWKRVLPINRQKSLSRMLRIDACPIFRERTILLRFRWIVPWQFKIDWSTSDLRDVESYHWRYQEWWCTGCRRLFGESYHDHWVLEDWMVELQISDDSSKSG